MYINVMTIKVCIVTEPTLIVSVEGGGVSAVWTN